MRTKIIKIGNSKGVRIPKPLLEESGINDSVDISANKEGIKITPIKTSSTDTLLLSEKTLAIDWLRPEEDEAWLNL